LLIHFQVSQKQTDYLVGESSKLFQTDRKYLPVNTASYPTTVQL